jgi:putative transposase
MKLLDLADPCLSRAQTCHALGIPRSAWYRQQASARTQQAATKERARAEAPAPLVTGHPPKDFPPAREKARALDTRSGALDERERQLVLATLHSERFVDLAPTEVYATLLDEGTYLCSIRTMYRLLQSQGEVKERRKLSKRVHYARPELMARGPNQLWSWDITKLRGPLKGSYFQLYVILDVFSRYVVGWMVAHHESAQLAQSFIEETLTKQGIRASQLILHSDRGPAMRSQPVAQLLDNLMVTKSHSRPYVSNDNPYSESAFKTLKYQPAFPDRFGSIEEARAFCRVFFAWYNQEHHHVGLC